MKTKEIISLHGLARELKLPIQWLKVEADNGRIPCLRAGRRRLFNFDAVVKVLAQRAAQGGKGDDE